MGSGRAFLAAVLVVGAGGLAAVAVSAANESSGEGRLEVEVAEVGSRFRVDEAYLDDDDLARRGASFLAEGFVYEAGTLTCDEFACNGVVYDEDGIPSPEFPDALLGTWTCTGTHLEDIAAGVQGPISLTTQLFDLGTEPGAQTLVTTGLELGSMGTAVERAITGGTGPYAHASGIQSQTLIGFNNIDVEFEGKPWIGITLSMVITVE
jgi:hypothetical protein